MQQHYDVIVAGAGPVGLFLAYELGLAGVKVLVLEREATPDTPMKTKPLGLRGLNMASADAFYRRGMLNDLFDADEKRPERLEKTGSFQFGGHFAGIMLDANKLDLSRWKYRLQGPSLFGGPTYLARIEAVLAERAAKLSVEIRRHCAITNVIQDEDGVTVEAGGQTFRAQWLAGCDGGRSAVRRAAGFEFVGTDAEFTGYIALCDLEDTEGLKPGFQLTTGGYIMGQFGQIYLMDYDGAAFDRSQEVTKEHFQSVFRRLSGTKVTVKNLHFASTFTDRAKQATTYRKGRVLLAGDSAHIHSPLGAQGLNTGIGDAINLGWKLAATVKGSAPEGLLDTYNDERHPIGAAVLEWSRAQVATARPNPNGQAFAKLIRDVIATDDGTNYFIGRIWGLSLRYDLGSEHPLVGASAPDFEFADDTRLGAKMANGRGLLIDFGKSPQLADIAAGWHSKVDYVMVAAKEDLGLRALLVRPDGFVAWVTEDSADAGLAAALARWF